MVAADGVPCAWSSVPVPSARKVCTSPLLVRRTDVPLTVTSLWLAVSVQVPITHASCSGSAGGAALGESSARALADGAVVGVVADEDAATRVPEPRPDAETARATTAAATTT